MVTVNSSVNLFVYCVFGERFRKELKKMIRPLARRLKRKKRPGSFVDCGRSFSRVPVTQTQTRRPPHVRTASETTQARTLAASENLLDRRGNKIGKEPFTKCRNNSYFGSNHFMAATSADDKATY